MSLPVSGEGDFGRVVMRRQMSQANPLQSTCIAGIQKLRSIPVRNVPTLAGNAILQMLRVRTVMQHLVVVVAFDQDRIEGTDDFIKAAEDVPQVGQQTESLSGLDVFDHEADAVDGIVRRSQRLNTQ